MLDQNGDGVITREEVLDFLESERDGVRVYPANAVRAVELYREPPECQIDMEEFCCLVDEVKYLIFPAYKLQKLLKDQLLGSDFWEEIVLNLEEIILLEKIKNKKEMIRKRMRRMEAKDLIPEKESTHEELKHS
eukprot:TRINITY_DN3176_c0_g1_i1.p2 TRINITY_DN3176_c0_g1~~TRINITY_DN3176_c0_g1_i1.p2  ORF type:complete len:134 (+),score=34.99 TRINITY_DN3176_c0_g1_i1:582-983(+)